MKVKTTEEKKFLWFYSVKICTLVLKTSLHCFGWYVWIEDFNALKEVVALGFVNPTAKKILVVKFITAKGVLESCWI